MGRMKIWTLRKKYRHREKDTTLQDHALTAVARCMIKETQKNCQSPIQILEYLTVKILVGTEVNIPMMLANRLIKRIMNMLQDGETDLKTLEEYRIHLIHHPKCRPVPPNIFKPDGDELGVPPDEWVCETCNNPVFAFKPMYSRW